MKPLSRIAFGVSLLVLGSTAAFSQSAISARSGMVHFVQGKVFIGQQEIDSKFGNFPQVKENQVLRSDEGRAEVLLTPGVFLRVAENSSFRMITDRLIDTRLEFLTGSIIVEADDILKDNSVTVVAKDATVHLRKAGIYRFDENPAQLRVFKGSVDVEANGKTVEVGQGKMLTLGGEMAIDKFDPKDTDALDRWSYRRGEALSMANISAAKSLRSSGNYSGMGLWAWNPYFGMFTFIPGRGIYISPYGFHFWSPYTVYRVYEPRPIYTGYNSGFDGNPGYRSVGATSSGYSGTMAAASSRSTSSGSGGSYAPSAGAAASASAPVSRGGGSAGGSHR
jgi:hypothetical protein